MHHACCSIKYARKIKIVKYIDYYDNYYESKFSLENFVLAWLE